MDSWRKESLNLEVGDTIIWQDEAIEMEGQPAVVKPKHSHGPSEPSVKAVWKSNEHDNER